MKKVLIRILIILVVLIALLAAGGSVYVGKLVRDGIFYQNQGADTRENSLKQLDIWGFDTDGFLEGIWNSGDFEVESEDGVKVPGTYYLADENKGYVVLVHGAGGDRLSVLPVVKIFNDNGYSVVTYDQRGCGDNSSDKVSFGIWEKRDLKSVVDYTRNTLGADKLFVCGQSMGGMTSALYSATDHAYENVDAFIFDSPVPNMEDMLMGVFMDDGTDEDTASYILWCGRLFCKTVEKLDFADGDTKEQVKKDRTRTLVILSKQDEICPEADVRELYENIAATDKSIVELDCAHIEGAVYCTEEYEKAVIDFLEN